MKESILLLKTAIIAKFGELFKALEDVELDTTISLTEGPVDIIYREGDDQFNELFERVTPNGFQPSFMGEVHPSNIIHFDEVNIETLAELYDIAKDECNRMLKDA